MSPKAVDCPDASHAEISIGSGEDRPRKTHTSRVHRWCEYTLSRARQSTSRFYSPGGRTEHRGFRGQPQLRSTSHPVNRLPSILILVMRRALPRQTAFVGQCGWDLFHNPVGLCSWKDPQRTARLLGHVVVVGGHLMLVALKNLTVSCSQDLLVAGHHSAPDLWDIDWTPVRSAVITEKLTRSASCGHGFSSED